LGPDSVDVADTLENLSRISDFNGDLAKSEVLYKRILSIRKKALGADDITVGLMSNNLALVYLRQKRYAEAEPLCQQALAIEENISGQEDSAAITLDSMAELYQSTQRIAEAERARMRAAVQRARPRYP